jgi:hypothetical protein
MNAIACECGIDVDSAHAEEHELSKEHKRYFSMKKAFKEAISKPVHVGVAS